MTLTSKQKRALKSQGMKMADDLRLGSAGLTEGFVQHLNDLLKRRELVKLRFTDVEGDGRQALAQQIGDASGAQCVSILGRTMLLYRPNPDLPPDKRVLGESPDS